MMGWYDYTKGYVLNKASAGYLMLVAEYVLDESSLSPVLARIEQVIGSEEFRVRIFDKKEWPERSSPLWSEIKPMKFTTLEEAMAWAEVVVKLQGV